MIQERERKHFNKSPITEAVINILVELPETISLESLDILTNTVNEDYPNKRNSFNFEAFFSDDGPTVTNDITGYIFSNTETKKIFQARLDGFAVNKLTPYDTWELFVEEAKRLWEIYYSVANPTLIHSITLRYIDKLDIPLPFSDFNEYITNAPVTSRELPQELTSFFYQIQTDYDDIGAHLILSQSMLPQTNDELVNIILDINLQKNLEISADNIDFWQDLETLHNRMNHVFRASITEKMEGIIE